MRQLRLNERDNEQVSKIGAAQVRSEAEAWLCERGADVDIGLPEYDDRLRLWRVALLARHNGREPVGELRVALDGIVFNTDLGLVAKRAAAADYAPPPKTRSGPPIRFRPVPSTIALGDARTVLAEMPPDTAQLVFTSPPYYNAKPEYHESGAYCDYLDLLSEVFELCHGVLSEGRFLVVNTSPVLVRRAHRNTSSRRIPIPFDLHRILDEIGFEFIDDIIWRKPEGAGWHLGRGRRFAADRQPLQYKPVSVTEYVMVYRRRTDRLIDWNIRCHPDPDSVQASLIGDGYERTNVWDIAPSHRRDHPAVFPDGLAERVVRYYSFNGDLVLDPFAGSGTTGRVAAKLGRRYMLIDNSVDFFEIMEADDAFSGARRLDFDYWATSLS